jgi:cytochrome c oxidase cbb3-type subunit III
MVPHAVLKHRTSRSLLYAPGAFLAASPAFAGTASDGGTESALLITGVLTILLIAVVFLALMLPEDDLLRLGSWFSRFRRYLISGTTEQAEPFDHEFDGIRELDNRIPPWFSTLFLATVVFGGVYMLDYHVFLSSPLSGEEYTQEVARAEIQRRIAMATEGNIDENTLTALTDPAAVERGGQEFAKYCVSCHGNKGQGLVGPNLTDDYWIHGGGIRNVYTTIKQGVPAKGMISWQLVFTPKQIQEIASFVLSLHGTNPPGAKKPEGQPYVEKEPLPAVTAEATKTTAKP